MSKKFILGEQFKSKKNCIALLMFSVILVIPTIATAQDSLGVTCLASIPFNDDDALRVDVQGDYAYVSSETGITIFNISNPENTQEVGFFELQSFISDIAHSSIHIYIIDVNFGLRIINISDLENLQEVGSFETPDPAAVYVSDNYAYLVGEGGLRIINISNPTDPFEAGFYEIPGPVSDVLVSNDCAFVSNDCTLRVIDVSSHSNLQEIGQCVTPSGLGKIALSGNYAYVSSFLEGFRIINISNFENPLEVGFFNSPYPTYSIDVSCDYVFVANGGDGLSIINIVNPANPHETGFYKDSRSSFDWDVVVVGDIAYTAGDISFRIYDCTNAVDVDDKNISEVPQEFSISNAYPNPFNPTLNVSISMPESSDLKVSVFNIMGQKVATVADRSCSAGTHNFTFDGSDLGSGVYFVHASVSGKLNQVKKVVLMK